MLEEIYPPGLRVVFVGTAVTELSDIVGFYHVHPRDRFWELLELGGIVPKRFVTRQELKALVDGHKDGSLSDPVRAIFTEKKKSKMLENGIGLTDLNRRDPVTDEKGKAAKPTGEDVQAFIAKTEKLKPRVAAFVILPELLVALFKDLFPGATSELGRQAFSVGSTEIWLLGSTTAQLRGEALERQEDAFFALGERVEELRGSG